MQGCDEVLDSGLWPLRGANLDARLAVADQNARAINLKQRGPAVDPSQRDPASYNI